MSNILFQPISTLFLDKDKIIHTNDYQFSYNNNDYYFTCYHTGEITTKALLNQFKADNEKLDYVILLCTDETLEEKEFSLPNGKAYKTNAVDFLKEQVKDYCAENDFPVPKYHKVFTIDFNNPSLSAIKGIKEIEKLFSIEDCKLYIDMQGGFRDVSVINMSVIKFLQAKQINYSDIFLTPFIRDEISKVKKVTNNYRFLDLGSGIDEFINYGKAKLIKTFFEGKQNTNNNIQNILKTMTDISSNLQICDMSSFTENVKDFQKFTDSAINSDIEKTDPLFEYMITTVGLEYNKFFPQGNSEYNFINLVKWCLEKEFIQQALTLYVEQAPKFFFDKGILDKKLFEISTAPTLGDSEEAHAVYTDLFTLIETDTNIIALKESIGKIKDDEDLIKKFRNNRYDICTNDDNETVKKAVESIRKICKNYYDADGNKIREKEYHLYQSTNLQINLTKFMRHIYKEKSFAHFFLYHDEAAYNSENKCSTIDKKLHAIEKLKSNKVNPKIYNKYTSLNNADLSKLMNDYLKVKTLRNNVNHASQDHDDIKKVMGLESISTELIINTISSALELLEKLNKQKQEQG